MKTYAVITTINVVPDEVIDFCGARGFHLVVVGDRTGALKSWFDTCTDSVLFLRPDRCIAGACIAQRAPELSSALFEVLSLTRGGGNGAASPVLHVAQPAAESSGTVAGSP